MKRILYFIQLPPPVHGVAKTNELVYKSEIVNKEYSKRLIQINYSSDLSSINKFNFYKIIIYFKLYFKFLWELLFFRPNLVYYSIPPTGVGFYKDFPFVLSMKLLFVKPLYHLHGKGIFEYTINSKFKMLLHRWAYSNSNIIHLSKNLMYKEIELLGLKKSNLFVVNNGVAKVNLATNKKLKDKRIDILFLSNLFVSKGILFALNILSTLIKSNEEIHLHIIGKFPEENTKSLIETNINNYGLENFVTIYGPLFGNDKLQIMSKTDFLLYPSFNDAYPLVILEALQLGLPVIASDQGAIPEIITEKVGYVFKTGDIDEALGNCFSLISELLKNPEHYRQNCIEMYDDNYDLKKFEEKMSNVYKKILCVE